MESPLFVAVTVEVRGEGKLTGIVVTFEGGGGTDAVDGVDIEVVEIGCTELRFTDDIKLLELVAMKEAVVVVEVIDDDTDCIVEEGGVVVTVDCGEVIVLEDGATTDPPETVGPLDGGGGIEKGKGGIGGRVLVGLLLWRQTPPREQRNPVMFAHSLIWSSNS